ncbi:MAG: anti-sigma factor family protein [Gemmatimonadaceae bacterium]
MTECQKLEVRELLPELAAGDLEGSQLVGVEAHLATCASCRAEVALLREARAVMHAVPAVSTARIADAVARSARVRREATATVAGAHRRRPSRVPAPARRIWLAAAAVAVVAVAGVLSTGVIRDSLTDTPAPVAQIDAPAPVTAPVAAAVSPDPARPARAEIVMGGGVSDLADVDLESLLGVLEGLDAQFDVEPTTLIPLLEGDV